MSFFNTRAVIYSLLILIGLASTVPNFLPERTQASLPTWFAQNTLKLGLDLQGGSHLLMTADTAPLLDSAMARISDQFLSQLKEHHIAHDKPIADGGSWQVRLHDPSQLTQARALAIEYDRASDGLQMFRISSDESTLSFSLTQDYVADITRDALNRSLEVVRRRLNETGLIEPSITRQGNDGVLVQMPGVTDPAYIRQLLGTTAQMSFHWVTTTPTSHSSPTSQSTITVPGTIENQTYTLEKQVAMEGEHISDARLGFSPTTGEPVVTFSLDNVGTKVFGEITQDNIGRPLAIVLDNTVITAPVIRSTIATGSGEISGNFTTVEARDLALLLRAGALPVPLTVAEERTVGPDLGSDAIEMGLYTGLFGAGLVLLFMTLVYRTWGLIACSSLTINIALIFGILSAFNATLTLPGIAGIILTIGMAVDANILINERIREESARGKRAMAAINAGFDKAYATIIDANVTTLIAVGLLFLFGNGPVRGFAVTIGIGLVTSMFTAISVTRGLIKWQVRNRAKDVLQFPGFTLLDRISKRNINFLGGRHIGLALSAILSLGSVGLFFSVGLNYGVDFTGGTLVEVNAEHLTVQDMRSNLLSHNFERASIQEFGDNGHFLVRLPVNAGDELVNANEIDVLKKPFSAKTPPQLFQKWIWSAPKSAAVLLMHPFLQYCWLLAECWSICGYDTNLISRWPQSSPMAWILPRPLVFSR